MRGLPGASGKAASGPGGPHPRGEVVYDPRGKVPGRGAYLCRSTACLEKAVKSRALARALETEITPEIYETLRRQMEEEGSE